MSALDVLALAVVAFMGVNLVAAARIQVRTGLWRRSLRIARGLRLRHVVPAPFVLVAVAATAVALLEVPLLSFGWWSAIGGIGNPAVGATETFAGSVWDRVIPAAFLLLLTPLLPWFAEREEIRFRAGAEAWSPARRLRRSVEFGLVHLIVGIPIAVALALSIGGLWFTRAYLRGWRTSGGSREAAVIEATRAHLAYNLTAVALFAWVLAFAW